MSSQQPTTNQQAKHMKVNVSFRIQKGRVNKHGESLVMVRVTWQGERVSVSTGQLITPDAFKLHWPQTRQSNALQTEAVDTELNAHFTRLKAGIEHRFHALERVVGQAKAITPDMVRVLVKDATGASVPAVDGRLAPKTIWHYHAEWQVENSLRLSQRALHRFDNLWQWLDEYAPGLELTALDERWLRDYANWVVQNLNPFTDKAAHDGTVGSHLRFFGAMLAFARMPHAWLQNVTVSTVPVVTLSPAELIAIRNTVYRRTRFHLAEELRQTADQYVLLSLLGIRYRDWLRLSEEDVTVVTVLGKPQLLLKKAGQSPNRTSFVAVLPDLAAEIWLQYSGRFATVPKEEFNERLRYIGLAAQLTRVVSFDATYNDYIINTIRPISYLLTARTARHTAAALLLAGDGNTGVGRFLPPLKSTSSKNQYAQAKDLQKIADSLEAWDILKHWN